MKKGFTLIELLIVVAIIAILAAIAVPNFLEAQTRAKISRAKADLRTIAVAVESYAVDYNGPPIGYYEIARSTDPFFAAMKADKKIRNQWSYSTMTSPVAYISTAPMDPFVKMGMFDSNGIKVTGDEYRLFHYQSCPGVQSRTGTKNMGSVYIAAAGLGVRWVANSVGPSHSWMPREPGQYTNRSVIGVPGPMLSTGTKLMYPHLIYDSTNGTKSYGYMIISNKGIAGS